MTRPSMLQRSDGYPHPIRIGLYQQIPFIATSVIVVAILGCGGRVGPAQDSAAHNSTQHALTGVLQVDADLRAEAAEREKWKGWFFVDGKLQGRLPFLKEIELPQGSHEVRWIGFFNGSSPNDTPSTTASFFDMRFVTISGDVTIEPGKKAGCRIARTARGQLEYPSGFKMRKSADLLSAETPVIYWNPENTPNKRDVDQKVHDVEGSAEFRLVVQLKMLPTDRKYVWVDVPEGLGGPRQIDATQLRCLGAWLHRWWLRRMPIIESAAFEGATHLRERMNATDKEIKRIMTRTYRLGAEMERDTILKAQELSRAQDN